MTDDRCGSLNAADKTAVSMARRAKFGPALDSQVRRLGETRESFGQGILIFPHGITVDNDGNVWVTDGQDGAQAERGAPPRSGPQGATKGNQVYKFSPDGKLLMTLGKPGGAAEPDYFYQPNDVLVTRTGEFFISEGHGGANSRILKFSKDGKLIKTIGEKGTGPGEFDTPHGLAMDAQGRLFVADRGNNRIQILDPDGKFIDQWSQFSRPSGIAIRNDVLYVATPNPALLLPITKSGNAAFESETSKTAK